MENKARCYTRFIYTIELNISALDNTDKSSTMTKKELKEKVDWTYFAVPTDVDCTSWLSNMLHGYEADYVRELKKYMDDCGEVRLAYSIIYCCAYDVNDNCTYFGYGKTRQDAIRDLYTQLN